MTITSLLLRTLALPLLLILPAAAQGPTPELVRPAREPAWFGAVLEGVELEGQAAAVAGVRLGAVAPGGPADQAGFREGDVLISSAGGLLADEPAAARAALIDQLGARAAGDRLALGLLRREVTWTRDGATIPSPAPGALETLEAGLVEGEPVGLEVELRWRLLELTVVLGQRPESGGVPLPPTEELYAHYPSGSSELLPEITAALESRGAAADQADLRQRLARLTVRGDRSRSHLVALVLREPWRLPVLAEALGGDLRRLARLEPAAALGGFEEHLARVADLAPSGELLAAAAGAPRPAKGDGLAAHLAWLEGRLALAAGAVEQSQAGVPEAALEGVRQHWRDLAARLDEHIYLELDGDRARFERNLATIAAGEAFDPTPLLGVPALFAPLLDAAYVQVLAEELYKAGHDVWAGEVLRHPTPFGCIVFGGRGDDVHRTGSQGADLGTEDMVALRIDLGGSDLYADGAGTTVNQAGRPRLPVSVQIDLEGDDVYESTHDGSIGAGVLGVGLVIDLSGNDSYVGTRWTQGAGFLGLGLVLDGQGDDRYRCQSQGQGIGAWGIGALVDGFGADRYEALRYGQAVGLPGGLGLCLDGWGDDEYYCKGRWPTGYGTAGVFEGWGQGCGLGLRGHASGGLGLLCDGAGRDRFEAGNFSQGGGYSFGFGGLWSHGRADDVYIGSRYDQGFAAHQAVGYFLEEGGDDRYTTRNAVAHGLAWDECVTWFEDRAGSDHYKGGSFSLGAAAHNSIAVFHERAGADEYLWGTLGEASSNQYHGGTSLGWFLDEGGERDSYPELGRDGGASAAPAHGFFRDR